MTDPVEIIAKAIDPAAWSELGCRPNFRQAMRDHALYKARAALNALEKEGFRIFSIVPIKGKPEPLVIGEDDE